MKKLRSLSATLFGLLVLGAVIALPAWASGAPENTAAPSIFGTKEVGAKLTGLKGTWTNEPTSYAYQWRRCNAAGSECVNISGATAQSYTVAEADHGHTLVIQVTATNSAGSASASSSPSSVVTPVSYPELFPAPTAQVPLSFTSTAAGIDWGGITCTATLTGNFVNSHTAKGVKIKNECSPYVWFTTEALEGSLGWTNAAKKEAALWLKPEAVGSNVFAQNFHVHGGLLLGSLFGKFAISGSSTEAVLSYERANEIKEEQKILGFEGFTEPHQLSQKPGETPPTQIAVIGQPHLKFPTKVELR